MNEQILKRLQDILKIQSAIIEQLEELGWIMKDLIEDLVLDLSKDMKDSSALPVEGSAPGARGKPSDTERPATENLKDGCPTP